MNQTTLSLHKEDPQKNWWHTIRAWFHPRVVTMLFFGFSAGVPILLIFSSLSLWLREAGVSKSAVTFFSWAALGYSFKFVWAPLVDTLPLPFLTRKLGKRRSWLLVAQAAVIAAICIMALTDPAAGDRNLVIMALAAVMLGFSSATQDIVIDAYRVECADQDMQPLLS
ncbi:MFS transporter, partial [Desulfobulbus sp. TB]|nr:MFS transporter [Desulfobulbus sp. TB]